MIKNYTINKFKSQTGRTIFPTYITAKGLISLKCEEFLENKEKDKPPNRKWAKDLNRALQGEGKLSGP